MENCSLLKTEASVLKIAPPEKMTECVSHENGYIQPDLEEKIEEKEQASYQSPLAQLEKTCNNIAREFSAKTPPEPVEPHFAKSTPPSEKKALSKTLTSTSLKRSRCPEPGSTEDCSREQKRKIIESNKKSPALPTPKQVVSPTSTTDDKRTQRPDVPRECPNNSNPSIHHQSPSGLVHWLSGYPLPVSYPLHSFGAHPSCNHHASLQHVDKPHTKESTQTTPCAQCSYHELLKETQNYFDTRVAARYPLVYPGLNATTVSNNETALSAEYCMFCGKHCRGGESLAEHMSSHVPYQSPYAAPPSSLFHNNDLLKASCVQQNYFESLTKMLVGLAGTHQLPAQTWGVL